MLNGKKIFITGASGFIGSNLVRKLVLDNEVYALARSDTCQIEGTKNVNGDILESEKFIPIFKKCDILFHCAAYISFQKKNFQKSFEVNVQGTKSILEAAHKAEVKKVVHLSACAVLGSSPQNNTFLDEKVRPKIDKDNVYAYTKALAEEEVQKFVRQGLDASIANVATVYGPGDQKFNSGSIIQSVYHNRMRVAPTGGTSFIAINDLLDGLILIAQRGKKGERYILCSENLTFMDLFNRIAKALHKEQIKYRIPGFLYAPSVLAAGLLEKIPSKTNRVNLLNTQIIKETFRFKYFDSKKAREELGWQPRVSLEEAVQKALDYYKAQGLIQS